MIQETARVTAKVEDEDVCVKMEEAEEVEKKPSTSLLDSLLYDDGADDILITETYTKSKKEMAEVLITETYTKSKEIAEEEIMHYRDVPKHKSPLCSIKKIK